MATNPAMLVRIAANLEELKRNLAEGRAQIEYTTAGMQKLAASLDGSKLEQRAHNIVAAINQVGGAAKLTDAEAQRHLRTLDAWIDKADRIGKQVPPDILKTRDALREVANQAERPPGLFEKIASTATRVAGILGIAFSVGAITAFAAGVINTAGQIDDLSKRVGASAEAVQRWKYAAEQGGATIEHVEKAVSVMNRSLAEGDKSTLQAVRLAGLSFDTLRAMKPEDAFTAITAAIKQIGDPMEQARLAVALFGKTGIELLPAIQEGIAEVGAGVNVMSDETVKRLADAEDAWGRLGTTVTIWSGEILAATLTAAEHATSSWSNFFAFAAAGLPGGLGGAAAQDFAARAALGSTPTGGESPQEAEARRRKSVDDAIAAAKALAEKDAAQRKATEAAKAYAAEAERAAEATRKMLDAYTGQDKIDAAARAVEIFSLAMQQGITVQQMTKERQAAINRTMAEAIEVYRLQGKEVPLAIRSVYMETADLSQLTAKLPAVVDGIPKAYADMTRIAIPSLVELGVTTTTVSGIPFGVKIGQQIDVVPPKLDTVYVRLDRLQGALMTLSSVAGGSFGSIVGNVATLVGTLDSADDAFQDLKDGASALKSGNTMAGITGMATGISGIVSMAMQAVQAVKAIWSAFDRNKGRDLVKDFAESFGGFDQLHVELLKLGDAGEALWIKLTQGVGRNNPEQAARVIAEVEAALEAQRRTQEEATGATEEGAQATIETATQAALALDELGVKIASNIDAWGGWSDAVTGYIENLAEAIRALPTPNVPGTGGTGPSAGNPSGGGIPQHGTGGYFDSPHLAIVGDRPEYITPRDSIGQLARELAAAGGFGGGPRSITLQTPDGRALWTWILDQAHVQGIA